MSKMPLHGRVIGSPVLGCGLLLAVCTVAHAADEAATGHTAPASKLTAEPVRPHAPAARTGIQMAFRTGLKFPFGYATGRDGDRLARRYAWQIPVIVDLGAKLHESVYLGGYFGLGFGAEGDDPAIEAYCDDDDDDFENDVTCAAVSIELGLRGQYHFQPAEPVNPYVGYGFGITTVYQNLSDSGGYKEMSMTSGLDYAKLEVGVDFRKTIGIGPFIEFTAGRFSRQVTEIGGDEVSRSPIDEGAWHYWLLLGGRLVVFP